jgi:hypothetical protein
MQSDYATMLGYTQRELEENFVEEIEMAAIHLQSSTSLSITHKSVHWMQDRALASAPPTPKGLRLGHNYQTLD